MMGWPYEFLTLTDEEKHQRRLSLDYYAYIAHLSAFVPALLFLVIRLINRVRKGRNSGYLQVPGSPGVKANRQRWISRVMEKGPIVQWWLGEDVVFMGRHWGQRDEWVLGTAWTVWLLVLSVRGTGKESGIWFKRFFAPVVFAGVAGFTVLHVLNGTAMARVRQASYRLFFIVHLFGAFAIPPLIYYHAPSSRFYIAEAVGVFFLDLAARKITTITAPAVIEAIPGTSLVKVSAKLPAPKIAKYTARPGSHIYLNVPAASRPGLGHSQLLISSLSFFITPSLWHLPIRRRVS
uniref:Ferric oxidoreductase domain-containing protein n=1 Tax=Fusarium oxysporum (strain Fo5176) TaxID=660025 RepID=A0A0D2XA13_FUSOF